MMAFADTICALVEHLDKHNVNPDDVELFEIYNEDEKKLNTEYCLSDEGRWLSRNELCVAFSERYAGHIRERGCDFEDRCKDITGP